MYDIVIVGAGAAGIFTAICAKEKNQALKVLILEKTNVLLSKVKISGGGRCNVTHHCFDPKLLTQAYPRGSKELLGPFHRFQPKDTIQWFLSKGVQLKTEDDGRVFPVSNSSQTIIDCLLQQCEALNVEIQVKQKIESIEKQDKAFYLQGSFGSIETKNLVLATGSSSQGHRFAQHLGHTIIDPIPSLFTFNIPSSVLKDLSGVVVETACLQLPKTRFQKAGPVLITHFGLSGPAVIQLSAFAAVWFADHDYQVDLNINWLPNLSQEQLLNELKDLKQTVPDKKLLGLNPFSFPKKLWKKFLDRAQIYRKLMALSYQDLARLASLLHCDQFKIEGKTTHKQEFVTCGGVCLKEVNFKTMESKICPSLFFVGEILNIDGITGGFNFQNAWTTGFIAGTSLSEKIEEI